MSDRRDFFENLVYHTFDQRRYLQQSPVMPDVWIAYGMEPGGQVDLLLVPDRQFTTAELASALKERLQADKGRDTLRRFRDKRKKIGSSSIAHNHNVVAATLWFDELIRAVLPLSQWWRNSIAQTSNGDHIDRLFERLKEPKQLKASLMAAWKKGEKTQITSDALWWAHVAGLLAHLSTKKGRDGLVRAGGKGHNEETQATYLKNLLNKPDSLTGDFIELIQGIEPVDSEDPTTLYSVNRNRETSNSLFDSVAAVKADASNRVFSVRGEGIRWAVIDSGIDAEHIAFRQRDQTGEPADKPFELPSTKRKGKVRRPKNKTRIVATYNFVNVRELLGLEPDEVDELDREKFPILNSKDMREQLKKILEDKESRMIDWQRLEPFLEVTHSPGQYQPPGHPHGTHVAGIIAADWRVKDTDFNFPPPPAQNGQDLIGISPEIRLYDLRVLDENGQGNEFAIMSALQFVRDLNNRKDFVAIHGVNLSFSIEHDVANYACGRTPVCEEAGRLVGNGTVVVAAAGNSGRARYLTPTGQADDGFRTVSITDPGNAQHVITVGSTHRSDPHSYGVSYFSSRGPTGDGRLKPDLVAPGEKIRSTVPGNSDGRLDGTSMAAPHVSGAAALILARHPEFIGQPQRIKEILCKTATDLGRERYFQGAGLLDILRALQSI